MSIHKLIHEAQKLSESERMQLIEAMSKPKSNRNLLELAGLGAEIWQDIDAQSYLNQLRDEWDHRQ